MIVKWNCWDENGSLHLYWTTVCCVADANSNNFNDYNKLQSVKRIWFIFIEFYIKFLLTAALLWILVPKNHTDWSFSSFSFTLLTLGSIYRRGARRWRKLYRINGHIFQAKRFNRVSIDRICVHFAMPNHNEK